MFQCVGVDGDFVCLSTLHDAVRPSVERNRARERETDGGGYDGKMFENDFSLPRSKEHAGRTRTNTTGKERKEKEISFLFFSFFIKYESWFRTVLLFNLNPSRWYERTEYPLEERLDGHKCDLWSSFVPIIIFFQNLHQSRTHTTVCVYFYFYLWMVHSSLILLFIVCSGAVTQSQFHTSKQNPLLWYSIQHRVQNAVCVRVCMCGYGSRISQ